MADFFQAYLALAGALLSWSLYRLLRIGRRPKDYPPGPPTLPLLGNLHQMVKKDPHLQFQAWAQTYGPVYSLMLGTKTMIVLSSDQAVKELLDKRSSNYSSRPDLYMGQTILSGGKRMVMMPYGPAWRMIRKVYHHALHVNKSAEYVPYQELENKQLLYDMMQQPDQLFEHLRRYSSSLITSIVYGFRWNTYDDPLLQTLFRSLDHYVHLNTTGGAALADFYPVLRRLPAWLSSTKRVGIRHYNAEIKLYTNKLWLRAKRAILDKTARTCVCKDVVELQKKEGFSDEYACHIPGQLWEAGSDTTSIELYGFVQALLLYPAAQVAGQAELDAVIGDDRLPTLDDMPNLPYVRACVKETLRWLPAAIIGAFPHSTSEEDFYNGHRIPKDAIILLNTWTIHRDPNRYPNPERFEAERYLGDDSTSMESATVNDVSRRDHFGFGAGRRICPGTNVADRSMLLGIARILWAFDVKAKVDSKGQAQLPKQDDFLPGLVAIPKPFEVDMRPRSEKRAEIVRKEWEKERRRLGQDGQYL